MLSDVILFLILILVFYIITRAHCAFPELYIFGDQVKYQQTFTPDSTTFVSNNIEPFEPEQKVIGQIYSPKAGSPISKKHGYYNILENEPFLEYVV